MDTREAIQKLPWLVNGSLDAAEAAAVREQLSNSDECRAELAELAEAGRLFGRRLPVDTLLDFVAERDVSPYDRETIERFLRVSPAGSEEWRMTTESWNALERADRDTEGSSDSENDNVLPFRRRAERSERAARTWRSAAIAASLLAVLGVGGWWGALRGVDPGHYNPKIVELKVAEDDMVLRDGGDQVSVVPVTSGPVVLDVTIDLKEGSKRTLQILDDSDNIVWSPDFEFVADQYGEFAVTLPTEFEPGNYRIQLYRVEASGRESLAGSGQR